MPTAAERWARAFERWTREKNDGRNVAHAIRSRKVIVTESETMRELVRQARAFAKFPVPVLIQGETGTGKELLAELIHRCSQRCERPFVRVNCAALSENLVASELFGHERGAFTDAVADRVGRFELASDGTLLLDEIGEVPAAIQAKLLRVIENREFERVGSSETRSHDVRIIAATNRDLEYSVQQGEFRLDLLHRLNVVQLRIPPLRARMEDLPVLSQHFIDQFNRDAGTAIEGIHQQALELLARHHWPGNVRELRNVIQRACILASQSNILSAQCISFNGCPAEEEDSARVQILPDSWANKDLAEIERQVIMANIQKHGNHRSAAEHLGVSTRTLTNKMKKYREQEGRRAA